MVSWVIKFLSLQGSVEICCLSGFEWLLQGYNSLVLNMYYRGNIFIAQLIRILSNEQVLVSLNSRGLSSVHEVNFIPPIVLKCIIDL